ncbi:MAG: hypothetical protein M3Q44_01025 [bacterium]|nr:hypothetical protein [bacterium]
MSSSEENPHPSEDRSTPSTHETAYNLVAQLEIETSSQKLKSLVAWFPSKEAQEQIAQSDTETQTTFIAETLGAWAIWQESVSGTESSRPQDGTTASNALGITQAETARLYPLITGLNHAFERYEHWLVETVGQGDLVSISRKLENVYQGVGFFQLIKDTPDVQVTLSDGTIVDDDPLMYFIDSPGRTLITDAEYDPGSNQLSINITLENQ